MLAISTMWNALRCPDGVALLDELKELGFDAIETQPTSDAGTDRAD